MKPFSMDMSGARMFAPWSIGADVQVQ